MQRFLSSQQSRGQSLVEFALVLPISLLVVLGIVVFGLSFARLEAVENAASEGARAAQRWTPGGPTCRDAVLDAIARSTPFSTSVDPAKLGPCDASSTRITSGTVITVQVSHQYSPLFFGTLFHDMWSPPTSLDLTAEVSVLHE